MKKQKKIPRVQKKNGEESKAKKRRKKTF